MLNDYVYKIMALAIIEAKKAKNIGEVPVGAIITDSNFNIISCGHNEIESKFFVGAHAEMVAIETASNKIKNWRLNNCKLFVTLEPCMMCSGAIILSRISEVYYGCKDSRFGAITNLPSQIIVTGGIMENECHSILKEFFNSLRKNK